MTNKELDNYMKTVSPNFDSHIEKGTIEMNNEYYNLLEEKMARLINQNKKLKKQVEDYIKSNMKLKEELSNKRKEYQDTYKDVRIEIKEYKTQQKEFILYLRHLSNWYSADGVKQGMVNEILQKYKEIIEKCDVR